MSFVHSRSITWLFSCSPEFHQRRLKNLERLVSFVSPARFFKSEARGCEATQTELTNITDNNTSTFCRFHRPSAPSVSSLLLWCAFPLWGLPTSSSSVLQHDPHFSSHLFVVHFRDDKWVFGCFFFPPLQLFNGRCRSNAGCDADCWRQWRDSQHRAALNHHHRHHHHYNGFHTGDSLALTFSSSRNLLRTLQGHKGVKTAPAAQWGSACIQLWALISRMRRSIRRQHDTGSTDSVRAGLVQHLLRPVQSVGTT